MLTIRISKNFYVCDKAIYKIRCEFTRINRYVSKIKPNNIANTEGQNRVE